MINVDEMKIISLKPIRETIEITYITGYVARRTTTTTHVNINTSQIVKLHDRNVWKV